MAGRHARTAPVLISRALATVTLSAVLLAIGVVAVTVFTGGERSASGGLQAQPPHVVAGPSTRPAVTSTASLPGATTSSTPSSTPGQSSGVRSGPDGGSDGGAGGAATTAQGSATAASPVARDGASATSPGGVAAGPPPVTAAVESSARGWLQRSDSGRAHGKAIGLLGRTGTGHGCRPVPATAPSAAAQAEPRACG